MPGTQQWVPIAINLTVHVIMCKYRIRHVSDPSVPGLALTALKDYYYYATAGGAKIWVGVSRGMMIFVLC